jgi:hypothetical protein
MRCGEGTTLGSVTTGFDTCADFLRGTSECRPKSTNLDGFVRTAMPSVGGGVSGAGHSCAGWTSGEGVCAKDDCSRATEGEGEHVEFVGRVPSILIGDGDALSGGDASGCMCLSDFAIPAVLFCRPRAALCGGGEEFSNNAHDGCEHPGVRALAENDRGVLAALAARLA